MTIIKFPNADAFIAALEERRDFWQAIDDERLAAHQVQEKAYLKAFKQACREAAKWTYEEAKKHHFQPNIGEIHGRYGSPSCPISEVGRLDQLIATLRRTRQQRFTLKPNGDWREAHRLLTFDPDAAGSLC